MSFLMRLREDFEARLNGMVDRRRVVGFEDDGRVRVRTLDPYGNYEESVPAIRGVLVELGDDAVLMRLGGRYVVVGALAAETSAT